MKKFAMITVNIDINSSDFAKNLAKSLKSSKASFHEVISDVLIQEASKHYNKLKADGLIVDYKFKPYTYPNRGINSLRDAIASGGGYTFSYLNLSLITSKQFNLNEKKITAPKNIKWFPISYGKGIQKYFKFKKIEQKTQDRYEINFLTLVISPSILKKAYEFSSQSCKCLKEDLRAVITGSWDWHVKFVCSGCGNEFVCNCFKKALNIEVQNEKNWRKSLPISERSYYEKHGWPTAYTTTEFMEEVIFKNKICHLCTGTPSSLNYSSKMYGSEILVKYGPYINKESIEKNISVREAENIVRKVLNVPLIGEGWVNETELFNILSNIFGKNNVIREASPEWLNRLRLDCYIPKLNLAVEYHGKQHFEPVGRFGGVENFEKGKLRDKLKKKLCTKNGVKIIYFKYTDEINYDFVKKKLKLYIM